VKCKVVLGGLAVIGILVLSATGAHASGGGFPSSLVGFLVCHGIEGDDPGRNFDVESHTFGLDASGNPIRQRVTMGKGSLACGFAKLFRPGGPNADPIEPGAAEQRTCYPINPKTVSSDPPPDYQVNDPLFTDPLNIAVPPTALKYLCAPSGYFPHFPQ
jgi:hypothetical protein